MAILSPITPYGSMHMLVNATTALFPSDGIGGTNAAVQPPFPATAQYVVEGFTVQTAGATANSLLTIMEGDGSTTRLTMNLPFTNPYAIGQFIPIGGLYGMNMNNGLSAKISAAGGTAYTISLWFRRLW